MIGDAWRRYAEWEAVDPRELVVGGNYDGTLLWKRTRDEMFGVDALLCGQCDVSTFARRFLLAADLPAFRRLYRQGIIYAADRTTTPWSPALMDAATPAGIRLLHGACHELRRRPALLRSRRRPGRARNLTLAPLARVAVALGAMKALDAVTIHVRSVPADLWHRVRVAAAQRGETLRTFVIRALEDGLKADFGK